MIAGRIIGTLLAPALVAGAFLQARGAINLRVESNGGIAFDGGRLSVVAYRPGYAGFFEQKIDLKDLESPSGRFEIVDGATTLFKGQGTWTMQDDGTVKGTVSLVCVTPVTSSGIALVADFSAPPAFKLGEGTARKYKIPVVTGADKNARRRVSSKALYLRFGTPIRYNARDARKWNKQWDVRFGTWQDQRDFAVGEKLEWRVTLSSQEGLVLRQASPCVIEEGDRWVAFDHQNDIEPGSALDFSELGLQDAPAGRHGWLKAKGGRFEFEGLPGVEQRFYGINFSSDANFLDRDLVDSVVDRLVRCGYNSIRVHYHDGIWETSAESREKLDYLIATCIKRGLYVTTVLYVARPVKWRDIGIDRAGDMKKSLYKTYVGLYEPAFSNWCAFAKAFLSHVNPHTGRAYADEPGMPLISLINEGGLEMGWAAKREDETILAAWRAFGGVGDLPDPKGKGGKAYQAFDEWINAKIWSKCSTYVRALGAKALLTNDDNGQRHGEGEGLTPQYDYVDNHVYEDRPVFLDEQWRPPLQCNNRNPIRVGRPLIFNAGWSKGSSKPYVITEWNFAGPSRYRGIGGILTGTRAAEQDWDGLWHFSYSHTSQNLRSDPGGAPGYFDCVTDPLAIASDKAGVCLFLRRDADATSSSLPVLRADREAGSMTIVSPRTCGGFVEAGTINAGPLTFSVHANSAANEIVPTTLWVSSLDGKPIQTSSRMLLTHLTDVQASGRMYTDDTRTILLKVGSGRLAEVGAAEVALRFKGSLRCHVWALASTGARRFAVPCRVANGALRFTASARGADGKGVMYYEIFRREP